MITAVVSRGGTSRLLGTCVVYNIMCNMQVRDRKSIISSEHDNSCRGKFCVCRVITTTVTIIIIPEYNTYTPYIEPASNFRVVGHKCDIKLIDTYPRVAITSMSNSAEGGGGVGGKYINTPRRAIMFFRHVFECSG